MDVRLTADAILVADLSGPMTLAEARALAMAVIEQARTQKLQRVLVDVLGAEGIETPGIAARIDMAHEWVRAAPPGLALAVVAAETLLDGERIATILAHNMGLRTFATPHREEAEAWLRAQAPIVGLSLRPPVTASE